MPVIEVTQLLKKPKCKKAAGDDNLSPGLLKDSAALISAPLTHIVNLWFQSDVFPSDWKIAKILPLFENGSTDLFENYRPIPILPVTSKVVEKIVHNRLVNYLLESKLLSKRQFGFFTLLCNNIRKNSDSKLLTGCVFNEFSKAFDTISHAKLIQKLNAYMIRNVAFEWFLDYLFNHKQLVNCNSALSKFGLLTCDNDAFHKGPSWTLCYL